MNRTARPDLASIGARFLARLIDGMLLVPIAALDVASRHVHTVSVRGGVTASGATTARVVASPRPGWVLALDLLVPALYEICFISWRGQTLGKMAAGVKVVLNDGTGDVPGTGRASLRYVVAAIGSLLRIAGPAVVLLWIVDPAYGLVDHDNRCLHDLAAGTVVVRARRAAGQAGHWGPPAGPPVGDVDFEPLRDPPLN